jgi:glucose-1-phosphate thymidylyltransferase
MIYYPLYTLIESGLTDILVISSREHCGSIMETLSDGRYFGCDFSYKIQDTAHVHMGIASALKLAKNFTKDEKFAVILGDNFFANTFATEMQEFSDSDAKACVFLKEVEDIKRFGCATVDGSNVTKIVEKPEEPESDWAVTGLYLYTPDVYSVADTLVLSNRGELEVTDINTHYCSEGVAKAAFLDGYWSDMGTPPSMQRTEAFIRDSNFKLEFYGDTHEYKL